MIDVLLYIVAIGGYIIISICMKKSSFDCLLSEGDYNKNVREANAKSDKFHGFFWPVVTCIYLCWSLLSKDWQITCIVRPAAALISAGISALIGYDNNKK